MYSGMQHYLMATLKMLFLILYELFLSKIKSVPSPESFRIKSCVENGQNIYSKLIFVTCILAVLTFWISECTIIP
jgi:hypothetical protein